MTLYAMSDSNQLIIGLSTAFFGFLTTFATLVIGYYMAKLNKLGQVAATNSELAVVATQQVKKTLAESNTQQGGKLTEIHDLVNSAMLEQKRMHAAKCRAAANDNPTAANLAEAEQAEIIFEAHRRNQEETTALKSKAVEAASVVKIESMEVDKLTVTKPTTIDVPTPPPRMDPQ